MRGASALQNVLKNLPEAPLVLFVVWEPVIFTDLAPPTTGVLAKIPDTRAVQFWDRSRVLSDFILRAARDEWEHPSAGEEAGEGAIVWDHVLIFSPGSRWDESPAPPDFSGGPVILVIEEVRSHLSRLAVK